MRPRPATEAALFVEFRLASAAACAAGGVAAGGTVLGMNASPSAHCRSFVCRSWTCSHYGGPAAQSCHEGGRCEEAATPGQPSAHSRAPLECPPGDSPSGTAGCRWLCRNDPANAEHHTIALRALCRSATLPATQNLCQGVQNLWTMMLPCGNRRKTRVNSAAPLLRDGVLRFCTDNQKLVTTP